MNELANEGAILQKASSRERFLQLGIICAVLKYNFHYAIKCKNAVNQG